MRLIARHSNSVQLRVFGYAVVSVLLLAALLTAVLASLYRQAMIAQIERHERERLIAVEANLMRENETVRDLALRYLALLRAKPDMTEKEQRDTISAIFTQREHAHIDSIYMTYPSGGFGLVTLENSVSANVWWQPFGMSAEGMAQYDPEAYAILSRYDVHYGQVIPRLIEREGGAVPVFTYVLPLLSLARTNYNRVLMVNMTSAWLNQMLEGLPSMDAYLLSGDGRVLASGCGEVYGADLSLEAPIKKILEEQRAGGTFIGTYRNAPALIVYARPTWCDWILVEAIPMRTISPEVDRVLARSLWLCAALILLTCAVTWVLSRRAAQSLNVAIGTLSQMDALRQENNRRLKVEYMRALLMGNLAYDERKTASAAASLAIALKTDDRFYAVGAMVAGRALDADVGACVKALRVRSEVVSDGEGGCIVFLCASEEGATRFTQDLTRAIGASGYVVATGPYAGLAALKAAYGEVRTALDKARFFGSASSAMGDESGAAELSALGARLIQSIRQRKGDAAEVLADVLEFGRALDFLYFRQFLNYLAFDVLFTLESVLSVSPKDQRLFAALRGDDFVREVSSAMSVAQVVAAFGRVLGAASSSATATHQEMMRRALCMIQERYASPDLSLGELAEACSLSQTYFGKLFISYTGKPFSEYLAQARVEAACQLLRTQPHRPIDDIACAVGYTNPKYFYGVFKKVTGLTPRAYRVGQGKR